MVLATSCRVNPQADIGELQQCAERTIRLNVETGTLEDLVKAGILDTAKMLMAAVETAFSYARVILKTDTWSVSRASPGDVGEQAHPR